MGRWLRGERGQNLVLVALIFTVLAAGTGLAIDAGAALQRSRALQNAADAAALLGARKVLAQVFTNVQRDITDVAERNGALDTNGVPFDGVNASVQWRYVDNAGATAAQAQATGVSVTVTQAVETRFMSVLGIRTVDVASRATAHVMVLTSLGGIPPIAVYENQAGLHLLTFDAGGAATGINPAAIDQTFEIVSPNGPEQPGNCIGGNSWKGLLDTDAPLAGVTIGGTVPLIEGTRVGQWTDEVEALQSDYLILPIIDSCNGPDAHVIAFGVFDVRGGGNRRTGALKDGYVGAGSGTPTWLPGMHVVTTLKLSR